MMGKLSAVLLLTLFLCVLSCCSEKTEEGAETISSEVSSEPAVVSLSDAAIELGKGLKHTLHASGGERITFSSTDEAIATVDENGEVTGVGIGQCRISAVNEDGSTADCDVQVKKVCFLTIDDGPTDNTEKLLDVLKEYDVKATFFVVNSSYLYTTKRMREQGCEVGLHSYSHVFKSCYATEYSYFYGIDMLSEKVEGYTGVKTNLLRFPGGTHNSRCNGLWMRRLLNGAFDKGYRVFDWTSTTGDTSKYASADYSYKNVKKSCTRDVEILLMHDRNFNNAALKKIIPYLRKQGYIFATLDQYPEESYHAQPLYSHHHPDLPSTSVRITHATFSIAVGGSILLVAKMTPEESTDYVRWESSDPSVATVSASGNVKGVKKGKVDIYAITTSGKKSVCHITVK